jgi:hypothetical protein
MFAPGAASEPAAGEQLADFLHHFLLGVLILVEAIHGRVKHRRSRRASRQTVDASR